MYPQENYATKSEAVKQTELSAIHSEFIDVNEKTNSLLNEVKEKLNKIHAYMEPSPIDKTTGISKPEEPSMVNSLNNQLRFANSNFEKLQSIVRHLNTLI
jgi:hypothetical protein